jgi:hypothetical protein
MPLNEAQGYQTRHHLTKQQRAEQERAIYGVPEVPMDISQLSHEDIEKMRQIVQAHDNNGKINTFDLNKPPQEPYRFREFPCMLYDHARRRHKTVHSEEERKTALAAGFRRDPFPAEEIKEVELDPADAAEAAAIDKQLRAKKK